MNEFQGIKNLSFRKLKAKDYTNMAIKLVNKKFIPIDSAEKILSSDILIQSLFADGPGVYLNATEFLVMGDFIKENDNFATVLSHGDFALDAIYHGAKDVTTFDINNNQLQVANLKFRALDKLDYETYFDFFCDVDSEYYLSPELYQQVKSGNKKDLWFFFWDYFMKVRMEEKIRMKKSPFYDLVKQMLYSGSSFDGLNLPFMTKDGNYGDVVFDKLLSIIDPSYKSSSFFKSLQGYGGKKVVGSYLESQESYLTTREKIKDVSVSYVKSDINSLKNRLVSSSYNKAFNSIYLSNIPEYLNSDIFFSTVNDQLMPLLKDDGVIVYCCQGVDPQLLYKASGNDVLQMRKECLSMRSSDLVTTFQEINDIESFQKLRELYDVSTSVTDAMGVGNGKANTDVFVYVRK